MKGSLAPVCLGCWGAWLMKDEARRAMVKTQYIQPISPLTGALYNFYMHYKFLYKPTKVPLLGVLDPGSTSDLASATIQGCTQRGRGP